MTTATDTRERILSAGQALIYARSYSDVGVAAICEEAGVQKGSFYHYFASKRDLTLAVLEHAFGNVKERLLGYAFDPDIPPLQRLERLVERAIEIQATVCEQTGLVLGCPFGNLASEMATQDEAIRQSVSQIMARMTRLIRDTLAEAQQLGEVGPIDVDATALAMVAYFEGTLLMAKTANDISLIERLLPSLTDIRVAKIQG